MSHRNIARMKVLYRQTARTMLSPRCHAEPLGLLPATLQKPLRVARPAAATPVITRLLSSKTTNDDYLQGQPGLTGSDHQKTKDMEYPLTKKEAVSFIENILQIPSPQTHLQEDRCAFLNLLVKRMNHLVPFSNVSLLSTVVGERRGQSLAEYKEEVTSLRGGSCFIINTFSKAMLERLGYTVQHIPGKVNFLDIVGSHCGTVVCDLTRPGSLHLVEPGTRKPLNEAIPLDFEKESPVYSHGHLKYKFFRSPDGSTLKWCTEIDADLARPRRTPVIQSGNRTWEVQLVYDIQTMVPLSVMFQMNEAVWPDPTMVPGVHANILVAGYDSDALHVSIRGKEIKITDRDNRTQCKETTSKAELIEVFQRHFPQFPVEMVEKAIDNTISTW